MDDAKRVKPRYGHGVDDRASRLYDCRFPQNGAQRSRAEGAPMGERFEDSTDGEFDFDSRGAEVPGEQSLWLAVIRQAFDDAGLIGGRKDRGQRSRRPQAVHGHKPIGVKDQSTDYINAIRCEALAFLCGVGPIWRAELERVCSLADLQADDVERAARREAAARGIAIPDALRWGHPAEVEDLTAAEFAAMEAARSLASGGNWSELRRRRMRKSAPVSLRRGWRPATI